MRLPVTRLVLALGIALAAATGASAQEKRNQTVLPVLDTSGKVEAFLRERLSQLFPDDTVIGEGTKIDNLVQIGHNCVIGRHCVIVSQVGIAGSSTLEDFVVLGGQVGLAGHLTIGMGAQVAAQSGVAGDVPRGAKYGGYPAQPALSWARESAMLKSMLAKRGQSKGGSGES